MWLQRYCMYFLVLVLFQIDSAAMKTMRHATKLFVAPSKKQAVLKNIYGLLYCSTTIEKNEQPAACKKYTSLERDLLWIEKLRNETYKNILSDFDLRDEEKNLDMLKRAYQLFVFQNCPCSRGKKQIVSWLDQFSYFKTVHIIAGIENRCHKGSCRDRK